MASLWLSDDNQIFTLYLPPLKFKLQYSGRDCSLDFVFPFPPSNGQQGVTHMLPKQSDCVAVRVYL